MGSYQARSRSAVVHHHRHAIEAMAGRNQATRPHLLTPIMPAGEHGSHRRPETPFPVPSCSPSKPPCRRIHRVTMASHAEPQGTAFGILSRSLEPRRALGGRSHPAGPPPSPVVRRCHRRRAHRSLCRAPSERLDGGAAPQPLHAPGPPCVMRT